MKIFTKNETLPSAEIRFDTQIASFPFADFVIAAAEIRYLRQEDNMWISDVRHEAFECLIDEIDDSVLQKIRDIISTAYAVCTLWTIHEEETFKNQYALSFKINQTAVRNIKEMPSAENYLAKYMEYVDEELARLIEQSKMLMEEYPSFFGLA